jgi:hypothetical protein
VGAVTDALVERVDELLHRESERPLIWGNPLVSTTPTSMAIHDLGLRIEALEEAVREIAVEVQKLLDHA